MYNPQQRKRFLLEIDNPCWIRITMAYTDYPGSSIQNKINLFADLDNKNHSTPNSQKLLGNEGAYRPLGSNIDKANNVEIIRIINAAPGSYYIVVAATKIIHGPQDFSLVITTNCKSSKISSNV